MFHLKQKTNEIVSAAIEKNQILSLQENSLKSTTCLNRKGIVKQMGKWGNIKQNLFRQI